jgi:oligosaccharyltransferase complex subunit alpha (ribophorin I)
LGFQYLIMKPLTCAAALSSAISLICGREFTQTASLSSHQILPSNFKPPQVFKNINLLRNINLEKAYVKESINVVVENTDKEPQDEYFIPIEARVIENIGAFEVRDKKKPDEPPMKVEVVECNATRYHSIL